jgi:hypothetical protein
LARARAALPQLALHVPWSKRWVVFAKPAVQGAQRVLQYLGRYVHRTALSDKAIVGCSEHTVSVAYRDSRDHQRKCMSLPAHEFLRRFLQHVPPKGLHRVRAFGLLHPAHRVTLRQLQLLLAQRPTQQQQDADEHDDAQPSRAPLRCPRCQIPTLRLLRRLSAEQCIALILVGVASVEQSARAPPSSSATARSLS